MVSLNRIINGDFQPQPKNWVSHVMDGFAKLAAQIGKVISNFFKTEVKASVTAESLAGRVAILTAAPAFSVRQDKIEALEEKISILRETGNNEDLQQAHMELAEIKNQCKEKFPLEFENYEKTKAVFEDYAIIARMLYDKDPHNRALNLNNRFPHLFPHNKNV